MVAVLILVVSVVALLKFAISQWRMIWLTTASQPISDSLRAVAGVDPEAIGASDFGPLLGLCDQLSPSIQRSTPWLREVRGYYRCIAAVEKISRSIQPALAAWAAREMQTCSRFVAVVLDQNLSLNLDRQSAAVRAN